MGHPNARLMQMTLAAGGTKMRKVNIKSIFSSDHNMFTDDDTEADFFFYSLFLYFTEPLWKHCALGGKDVRCVTLTERITWT